MLKLFFAVLTAFLLVFSIAPSNLFAQQEQIERPDFGVGVFDETAERMERLIRLKWNGENIGLRKNWQDAIPLEEQEETRKLEQAVLELVERGVPERQAERFAAGNLGIDRGIVSIGNSPFHKLFFRIRGSKGGSSGSHGSKLMRLSFSNEVILGSAHLLEDEVELSFEEKTLQRRRFEFRDHGNGEINFRFEHGDLFIRLRQDQDGNTQLIWIEDDQAKAYVGKTFQDFIENNTQVAERVLFPLFTRLGIKMPMDKTDPRVVANVVAKIKYAKENDDETVRKLIKQLGSDSFEIRENASKTLANCYEAWAHIIKEHLTDASLSPEAEFRLNEIVEGATNNELEQYVGELKLLDSPEYLVSILNIVDVNEKLLLIEHLEELTEQSHGDDIDAWQKWLQKKK